MKKRNVFETIQKYKDMSWEFKEPDSCENKYDL